ncbi:MAG TPA: DUF1648 domain-containing protein, partial [Propionibacterium sp.]|nr:DUF1648 domain-containing protein [Propionibacterium sp.]
MITSLDQLSADARAAAQAWLDASVAVVDADLRDDVRDELTIALCEGLDASAGPEEVAHLITEIGPVSAEFVADPDADPRVGRWFGIPFDLRPPTGERFKEALWDPADPRLMKPRAFGAGWDMNFGAAAVKLGLIEPDAEDEPFANTPHDAFALAAGFPALMAAAVVAHYAVRGRSLPELLPSHWGPGGRPDRWVTKGRAASTDIGLSLVAAAVGAGAASRTHGAGRAGRMALAAGLAGGVAKMTVIRPMKGGWWVGPTLVAGV